MKKIKNIKIQTEFIKLDSFLKYAGIAATGGEAKYHIQNNEITINGTPCNQRGKKLRPGDQITLNLPNSPNQTQQFKII